MQAIIKGTEVIIPMTVGELPTKNGGAAEAVAKPAVDHELAFWTAIAKLEWKDSIDGGNPRCPSQKWTYDEFRDVQREIRFYYDRLSDHLTLEEFWDHHNTPADERAPLVWHIIGRGQQVYTAVMDDVQFLIGFMGQECGFQEFMKRYV